MPEHWILHWTQIELGRHLCLSPTVEEKGTRKLGTHLDPNQEPIPPTTLQLCLSWALTSWHLPPHRRQVLMAACPPPQWPVPPRPCTPVMAVHPGHVPLDGMSTPGHVPHLWHSPALLQGCACLMGSGVWGPGTDDHYQPCPICQLWARLISVLATPELMLQTCSWHY